MYVDATIAFDPVGAQEPVVVLEPGAVAVVTAP
jgi:hypothetical protein